MQRFAPTRSCNGYDAHITQENTPLTVTSRLPELATALRHVFIVSGVQLLAKATSFHVAPGDIIKIVLVSFVLFNTDMNNCCLVVSAPGKTGSSIKITTNKKGGHSWPPLRIHSTNYLHARDTSLHPWRHPCTSGVGS